MTAKLSAPDGTPTTMIVGFLNMLFKVQDELRPDCTVIVFDASSKLSGHRTFRYELQEDYKGTRAKPLEELSVQLPILQNLLRLLGYKVVIHEGVEADDVAASIARLAQKEGCAAVVLSSEHIRRGSL